MSINSIANPHAAGNCRGFIHPGTWADETRVERLKQLWADGLPASEIAALLGEVTRNAVIGKVHRLGLAGRKTTSRTPRRRRTSPLCNRTTVQRSHSCPSTPDRLPPAAAALMLSVGRLTDATSHWPIGDPRAPSFGFCGRSKSSSVPYCEHHAAIAYNPAGRRGRYA